MGDLVQIINALESNIKHEENGEDFRKTPL